MSNQEKKEKKKELVIKQLEEGLFVTEHDMQNMQMERFVVSNLAILEILKQVKLTIEEQEEAVDALVHRTTEWRYLDTEDQIERIKSVLTTESILVYLQEKEYIKPNIDLVEVGVDEEGSIVVYAYYTGTNREKRRALKKKYGEEGIKEMIDSLNFMGGQNIVDLAKEKMERMEKKKGEKQ